MDVAFFVLLGVAIGSFLNVCIDRLPRGENILVGRSHCDYCKKPLRWFELIPIVSFIIQRGRCRRCRKRLSLQYPIIEAATGISFGLLYIRFLGAAELISALIVLCAFLVIFVADLKYQIIPDSMLFFLVIAAAIRIGYQIAPLRLSVASAAASGLFFLFLWLVTRGKGMGLGDVKLAAVLGLLLGFPGTVIAFYIAFLTGAVAGVILMIGGKVKLKSRIAFGPFLLVGSAISLWWGVRLWQWWQHFL